MRSPSLVLSCVNVVAWQRLGGNVPDDPTLAGLSAAIATGMAPSDTESLTASATPSPAATPASTRGADRGPLTAIVLIAAGLVFVIAGSVGCGRQGRWLDRGPGRAGTRVRHVRCERIRMLPASTTRSAVRGRSGRPRSWRRCARLLPAGERVQYRGLCRRRARSIAASRRPSPSRPTASSSTSTRPTSSRRDYTFRYLWGAELMAEGTFTVRP